MEPNPADGTDKVKPKGMSFSGPNRRGVDSEGALERFAIKMAALHDLSVDLSVAEGIDELCERAVTLGRIVLGFDRIGIWFVDSMDPGIMRGSYGTDESGNIRDERGVVLCRSESVLAANFYEGKEPVYFLGKAPCFGDRMNVVGEADKALRVALPLLEGNDENKAGALFNLGIANSHLKNVADAVKFFEQCIAIKSPYQPTCTDNLKAIRSTYRVVK